MMVDWLFTYAFGSGISTVKYASANKTEPATKPMPPRKIAALVSNLRIIWQCYPLA